jgi:hypothetical protein
MVQTACVNRCPLTVAALVGTATAIVGSWLPTRCVATPHTVCAIHVVATTAIGA